MSGLRERMLMDDDTSYKAPVLAEPEGGPVPKWTSDLTAGGEPHTGAMIALVPSEADCARLAVAGGEPADELHTTIIYLGDAANFTQDARAELITAYLDVAGQIAPFKADAFAVAVFNPPSDNRDAGEREPCDVLLVSGETLLPVKELLCDTFYDLELPVACPKQHQPWYAHITLLYADQVDPSNFADKTGPVMYDRLRLAFGPDVYDIPLGDGYTPVDFNAEMAYALAFAFEREGDVNALGRGHNLRDYWVRGPGAAEIGWGTDGSMKRCIAKLSKHVKSPGGLCAEYHKQATGQWPTEGGESGIPS